MIAAYDKKSMTAKLQPNVIIGYVDISSLYRRYSLTYLKDFS